MEKLNVCLLNDSFPPTIDGVANTTFNYASVIQEKYGNAIVATPKYPNIVDNYPFEVLRYLSIDTTNIIGYRAGIPFSINFLSQFNNRNIDIIHSHCPVSSTYLARVLRDSLKKPIIMTYHTKFDIDIKNAVDNKLIQDVAIKALVNNISSVNEVWAVSKGAGENLKSLGYKGDYVVMANGVDFSKGKASEKDIETIRQQYNIPKNNIIYLFVGRLMWYKGIKIILDALREVKNHNIPFTMLFVGSGSESEEMKEYARKLDLENECIFTGAIIDRQKLKAFFSISNLFLFPSVYDTNGIVVREAAAAGLASVLIEGSCASEDTINEQNCLWIKEDYKELANILISNGTNSDYFTQLGLNAQRDLYLSWEESIDRAVERYKEVNERYKYEDLHNGFEISEGFYSLLSLFSHSLTKGQIRKDNLIQKSNDFKDSVLIRKDEFEERIAELLDRYL